MERQKLTGDSQSGKPVPIPCDYCHEPADGAGQPCILHPLTLWLHPACQTRMLELYRDPNSVVRDFDGKEISGPQFEYATTDDVASPPEGDGWIDLTAWWSDQQKIVWRRIRPSKPADKTTPIDKTEAPKDTDPRRSD